MSTATKGVATVADPATLKRAAYEPGRGFCQTTDAGHRSKLGGREQHAHGGS